MEIIIAIVMTFFTTYGVMSGGLEGLISSDLKKAVKRERQVIIENSSYQCVETQKLHGVRIK